VVESLRGLGLTLAEIQELAGAYLRPTTEPFGPRLAAALDAARARTETRIGEMQERLARIAAFRAAFAAELAGQQDFHRHDPLDSPPGGRA
jgi:DNA-binding transcriptional MerR regulator